MKKLNGKVAIITGASSGIGAATAKALAQEGATVVLAARREDRLMALCQEIEKSGGRARFKVIDVRKRQEVSDLIDFALGEFGRIDFMINNAGIMPLSTMSKLKVEEWERTVDINIKGVLYGIAAALPVFERQKSGHFVNIASVGGRHAFAGCAVYCGTKFAVRAISQSLRLELNPKDNIKVTVIEPGAVSTELPNSITDTEFRETLKNFASAITFLEPEDIAESIRYAVTQADRVNVDEILIMPREQAV